MTRARAFYRTWSDADDVALIITMLKAMISVVQSGRSTHYRTNGRWYRSWTFTPYSEYAEQHQRTYNAVRARWSRLMKQIAK